jgi:hypothetical protein
MQDVPRGRRRVRRSVIAATILVAIGTTLMPSAKAADTDATFAITAGGLAISVPASTVALGTAASGASSVSGQLGAVSVTDTRGNLVATWTTTVSSTTFTTGTATSDETVALADISYASGAATATSGVGVFVPMANTALSSAAALRTVKWTVGIGNNSATWNPTLSFTLQGSQVAGTYSGTVSHSVI